MIKGVKICGISDLKTLNYITEHPYPPQFIGFITNYRKSKRYVEFEKLKELVNIDKKKGINFVSVLVNPDYKILEKIKNLKFDYYQLYNVTPEITKLIKEKYKIKIISALTINNKDDVDQYKKYETISDIILFDGKGYEKSFGFDHKLLNNVPNTVKKMLAGNIQYNDELEKFSKIADIIDISGSLETAGKKDTSKINILLENISEIKNEN
jgi:phosphoribosylanthranilate isomerase|tara:strand:- start:811 stop:1443 length:633 start_codon:yes stop_codon:yes gene_type:complete